MIRFRLLPALRLMAVAPAGVEQPRPSGAVSPDTGLTRPRSFPEA